ncbi:putative nuclease HARBI1 isoform X1 [Gossypium hirsutum]|uniref:Nuclease HARBI1 isoform X1 n=1 Tax=Gossypium hirsutum TaxID=3635 RepID=A0ABM2ZKY5_GOSHI|nr:putative nuclease HARBI1 isoform X1 [Gossypium hirsutum]
MSIVEDYTGDESDDEREKKDILQRMEYFNRLFVVASSSVQLYYEKYILRQSCMDSTQSGTGAKVSQCRERFQRSGSTISRHFAVVLEKVSRMATDLIAPEDPFFSSIPEQIRAIDGTHIAAILPPNEQIPYIGRKGIPTQNVMAICDFNMCFTFVMAGWEGSAHDTRIFLEAIRDPKYKFPHLPNGKYYLVDSGYPQMKGYLGPYRGQRYHLPDFRRGRPISGKEEIFNHSHSSLRSVIERTFGVLKKMGHFKGYAKL